LYFIIKYHLRTLHVHPNCLSLLCTVYQCVKKDRCMINPRRYRIRCLLYIKRDTHKLLTIFNVLRNLISVLLAACESTTVLYTTWRRSQVGVTSRCPFCWCYIVVGFQFHISPILSPVSIEYYGCDIAVVIASRYVVHSLRLESRCVWVIPLPSQTALGPTSLL